MIQVTENSVKKQMVIIFGQINAAGVMKCRVPEIAGNVLSG